jgi:hypothetical protein
MQRIVVGLILVLIIAWAPGRSVVSHAAGPSDEPTYTVMAAGDIACDPTFSHFNGGKGDDQRCHELATSDLLVAAHLMASHPDAVLALGDNQYEDASLSAFQASYDPTWGRLKAITYPVAGNHEYVTPGAAGYFAYFGNAAAPQSNGYYSFDVGAWHFIALNSNCDFVGGCNAGSQQEQWLLSDLAAHRNACTVAYWHFPRFTSGTNLNHPEMGAIWDDLYAEGADIVLNGHDHDYERFAPQTPGQQPDPERGIREFVVGTGGRSHGNFIDIQPNSEVRDGKTFGVFRLMLHKGSYEWQFVPDTQAGNGKFTDKGSANCHGTAPGTENGSGPRAVPVVTAERPGASIARFTVDFTSSKPGQAQVLFGPGPDCSGLIMTATGDHGMGTTHHWFVVTGNDLAGVVGDSGITPGTTYWYETVTMTASGPEIDNNGGKCYSVSVPRA